MLPRPSDLFSSQPLPSSGEMPLVQHASVITDTSMLTLDIQMRLVAELEDAYWQTQFSKETYYAAGRGYDQYRPAYELGWSAALEYPDAQFFDLAQHLELQWERRKSTSLLPWREVQYAVKEAWVHAAKQMQTLQKPEPIKVDEAQVTVAVDPLHRACVLLADDLRRMSHVTMGEFAQQVLGRHMRLLKKMAFQLKKLMADEAVKPQLFGPLKQRLRGHWRRLKLRLAEWDADQVFEVCELRERSLLAAYQASLRKPLPSEIKDMLIQHVKLLQSNMEKLSWVRQNWAL